MSQLRKVSYLIVLIAIILYLFLAQTVFAYGNVQYGFSINPPSGWSVEEEAGEFPVTFVNYDTFSNINVGVEVTSKTLSEYVAYSKPSLQTLNDYILVSEGSRVINGLNSYEIVFTMTDDELEYELKQVIIVQNGKAYVISCTALKSEYANSASAFEQSIQSFQLVPNPTPVPTATSSPIPEPSSAPSPTNEPTPDAGFSFPVGYAVAGKNH